MYRALWIWPTDTNMSKTNVNKYKKKQRLTNIAPPNDLTMKPVWGICTEIGERREVEGEKGGREGERKKSV